MPDIPSTELGAYGVIYSPFTPANVSPRVRDMLSYDWIEVVSQFSQKFVREVYATTLLASEGTYNFDYSSLGEDHFPPVLKLYWYDSRWRENIATYNGLTGYKPYFTITDVGLATCNIINNSAYERWIYLIAYT